MKIHTHFQNFSTQTLTPKSLNSDNDSQTFSKSLAPISRQRAYPFAPFFPFSPVLSLLSRSSISLSIYSSKGTLTATTAASIRAARHHRRAQIHLAPPILNPTHPHGTSIHSRPQEPEPLLWCCAKTLCANTSYSLLRKEGENFSFTVHLRNFP